MFPKLTCQSSECAGAKWPTDKLHIIGLFALIFIKFFNLSIQIQPRIPYPASRRFLCFSPAHTDPLRFSALIRGAPEKEIGSQLKTQIHHLNAFRCGKGKNRIAEFGVKYRFFNQIFGFIITVIGINNALNFPGFVLNPDLYR